MRSINRETLYNEVFALHCVMDSPYCVHLYEAWEEDSTMYIRTEFCGNGTLQELFDGMPDGAQLSSQQIWEFFTDIVLVRVPHHDLPLLIMF